MFIERCTGFIICYLKTGDMYHTQNNMLNVTYNTPLMHCYSLVILIYALYFFHRPFDQITLKCYLNVVQVLISYKYSATSFKSKLHT